MSEATQDAVYIEGMGQVFGGAFTVALTLSLTLEATGWVDP